MEGLTLRVKVHPIHGFPCGIGHLQGSIPYLNGSLKEGADLGSVQEYSHDSDDPRSAQPLLPPYFLFRDALPTSSLFAVNKSTWFLFRPSSPLSLPVPLHSGEGTGWIGEAGIPALCLPEPIFETMDRKASLCLRPSFPLK